MSDPIEQVTLLDDSLNRLFQWVQHTRQVDLSSYELEFVKRQIHNRLSTLLLPDFESYLAYLHLHQDEVDRLLTQVGITYTRFFRDPLVFETLADRVFPSQFDALNRGDASELRLWSAGCATGEEAYSLAILLQEEMSHWDRQGPVRVFATDINQNALQVARCGEYTSQQLVDTRLGLLERYFDRTAEGFRVKSTLRSLVDFSCEDVARKDCIAPAASIYGGFDLILCRNILIYLTPTGQKVVIEKLARALSPGGYLVLGRTEIVPDGMSGLLSTVDSDLRLYRRHAC